MKKLIAVIVSLTPNVCSKISGMILSYICQNAEIDKNAIPINMVLPTFNFICFPPILFPSFHFTIILSKKPLILVAFFLILCNMV